MDPSFSGQSRLVTMSTGIYFSQALRGRRPTENMWTLGGYMKAVRVVGHRKEVKCRTYNSTEGGHAFLPETAGFMGVMYNDEFVYTCFAEYPLAKLPI